MNEVQANLIPLTDILRTIGCEPADVCTSAFMYNSPFHDKQPLSLVVKPAENTWQDDAIAKGGNCLDFVILHLKSSNEDHTISDALRWLTNMVMQPIISKAPHKAAIVQLPGWQLKRTDPLEDLALIRYAEKRGIPFEVAYRHFVEAYVQNRNNGERIYALGFKNEDGGCELRNIYIKSCVAPKTITFKRGEVAKPKAIHLFEGSFDYLSALIRFPQYVGQHDCIILNSIACLELAYPYITGYGYQTLYSWMDNDLQGRNTTKKITDFVKSQEGLTHKPLNGFYRTYKDVNDWHQSTYAIGFTV
ncbi:toprim domain-containing protein [Mucilaginibacter terrae]|uniref:toprim domain-containing protein n=1 Tax=Mucilaginibacter terrae TaxID=1955052 RepID=UPI00363482B7